MKILHHLGHNNKWSRDAFFENGIGDGFIYCAISFEYNKLQSIDERMRDISSIDLQFYGKNFSDGLGKFDTIPFHPANTHVQDRTLTDGITNIIEGIQFQETLGVNKIIIPSYYEDRNLDKFIGVLTATNDYMRGHRKNNTEYYMTLPLSNSFILDSSSIDRILTVLTDMRIVFDGYYIVCETNPGYKQKISVDYNYLENLSKVFITLKQQDFFLIYGYANWDALVFTALCDIDNVSIGTYENLRNFSYTRYSQEGQGGPSDGWYFSEKLLNFIKAKEITNIRRNGAIQLIQNEKNIFSDIILDPNYVWNTHKPEIHKNYLLSISRLLTNLSSITDKSDRITTLLHHIDNAQLTYRELAQRRIFLPDESDDYFLGTWKSFLRSKQ